MKKIAVAAAVCLLLVAGCAQDGSGDPAAKGLSTPVKETGSARPTLKTMDKTSAVNAASKGVTAWAQPKQPEAEWTKTMKEFLRPDAKVTYQDMVAYGATQVTGDAEVQPDASNYKATAMVPTDKGKVKVSLERESGFDSWLISQIEKA